MTDNNNTLDEVKSEDWYRENKWVFDFRNRFTGDDGLIHDKYAIDEMLDWIETKKKEWQEEAYEKGKEDADFLNNQFNRP